jgi:hypothetical protein
MIFVLMFGLAAGCTPRGPFARQQPTIPVEKPTAEQVVNHLNHQARGVQSLKVNDVSIQVKQGMQFAGLNGELAYEKPRNFRMTASAANTSQADFGSNSQEFWFWVKQNKPPALFHCSYEDLPRCQGQIPIHPDWIAEALGVTEFNPANQYQVKHLGENLELVSQTTSPQGQPMQKVTVVGLTGRNSGRIISHHLRNAQGQEVWSAYIKEHQEVGGYLLPRRVKLICPTEKLELDLNLGRCEVNRINPQESKLLFTRPRMNVETIDLARGVSTRQASIQRVRGSW